MISNPTQHPSGNRSALHMTLLVVLSIIVAIRITLLQHGWVNDDSLLYFETARLLTKQQWAEAYQLYPWLFYPALLAAGHMMSGLSIHMVAQLLNIALFGVFSLGYGRLLIAAGAKSSTLNWGFALMLSTPYMVGDVLGMLLRDQGFWAGFVWGLYFLLSHLQKPRTQTVLLMQLCFGIATLFRIEGIVYLLALPLFVLNFQTGIDLRHRISHSLNAISLSLLIASLIGLAIATGAVQTSQLGRVQEIITLFQQGFVDRISIIQSKAMQLGNEILGEHLDDYGSISLWSTLILIVFHKTIKVAGWPVLFFLYTGRAGLKSLHPMAKHLFGWQLAVGLITSFLILFNVFVLSARYVIASGIVMLVLSAFATNYTYQQAGVWIRRGIITLLSLMLMYNLHDNHHVDLDREAVNYIQHINKSHAPVMYDTENARFYAGQPYKNRINYHFYVQSLIDSHEIWQYDYLMVTIKQQQQDYAQHIAELLAQEYVAIKTIYGWRNKDKVVIYVKKTTMVQSKIKDTRNK